MYGHATTSLRAGGPWPSRHMSLRCTQHATAHADGLKGHVHCRHMQQAWSLRARRRSVWINTHGHEWPVTSTPLNGPAGLLFLQLLRPTPSAQLAATQLRKADGLALSTVQGPVYACWIGPARPKKEVYGTVSTALQACVAVLFSQVFVRPKGLRP